MGLGGDYKAQCCHDAVTMTRMHRLFGVTMIERGVSRLVSVDLGERRGCWRLELG